MGKGKLSVTLDEELLRELDRAVGARARYRTRSAVVEDAVRIWLRAQRVAEARAYYEDQTEDERAEELVWADAAGAAMASLYDED
jgi:Arc/MetJ-type ribon-helix-helix transcriptional regulator